MGEPIDFLTEILSHNPSQSTLLLVLTKMKEDGRFDDVIRGCLRALSTYPDEIRLRILLVESYIREGLIGQAEKELVRVTLDIDSLVPAYKTQAELYFKQQRLKEAVMALKRYLVFNPDDQDALQLLDAIGQSEGEELAETESQRYDQATPTLAEIYYKQGQIQDAINTYEKVLLSNPNDEVSRRRLSELRVSATVETGMQEIDEDAVKTKKQEMITILEGWLARLHTSN